MSKESLMKAEGTVVGVVKDRFTVKMGNGHEVTCVLAGKLRKYRIRILEGDKVRIEVTPYDITQGRIVYRYK